MIRIFIAVVVSISLSGCNGDLLPAHRDRVNEYAKTVQCDEGFYASLVSANGGTAVISCSKRKPMSVETKVKP